MATNMFKKKLATLGRSKKPKSDLWIRIKGQKAKTPYHCMWPPFCGSRPDIEWVSLTTHEVTFPHVRLYQLSETDSLSVFVSFLEQLSSVPTTMAIVVVNTDESYHLDARFSTENYRETPVPVVVVKKKTGRALLEQVGKYGRDIEASIEGGKEEEGKTDTLGRGKDKKSKKAHEDKGSPSPHPKAVALPQTKEPLSKEHDLQVRVKREDWGERYESRVVRFTFPASQPLPPLPWTTLATSDTTSPHVRLCELEDDDLSGVMATVSTETRAIVVVNSSSRTYEDILGKLAGEEAAPPTPRVLVVTREEGAELARLAREHPGMVEVGVGVAEEEIPPNPETETRESMFAGPETERTPVVAAASKTSTAAEPERDSAGIVKNGLKVRIKSQPSSTARAFDYVPAPFYSSLRAVPWADLSSTETTYPHLRLHQLSSPSSSSDDDEDCLSFFFSTVASLTANLALVLINSDNSFTLAGKLQSLSENQIPPFPVVMVTKETGAELLKLSGEHLRDVEAMIELPPGQREPISLPASPPGSPPFRSLSTTVVKKGLKLRLTSTPSQELAFDYVAAPFSLSLRSVDWARLSSGEATSPHVRLHELKEEDSLSFFMAMLSSIPATLAVVLVNHQDGFELSERLSGSSEQGCPVPMVVVTREAGREMARLLRENERAVEAMVEVAPGSKFNASPALSSPSTSAHARGEITTKIAGSHHKTASISHSIIKGGLELHDGSKLHRFDYGWCSFNQSSVRQFQTLPLTLHEATFPHYRLHRLTHEDSLKFFMSMVSSMPATLAIILINFDHTYRLSERFVSEEGETPPVPVILVTNETGAELVRLLEGNPRDVKAVIHAESQNSATPPPTREPQPSLVTSPEYEDMRGLHVKIGFMGAVVDYEYVPGPYRQEIGEIDWICVTASEATFPHIRIHDLKMEDSLSFFMSTMASTPAALAVVFVNTDDHFRLADKFRSEEQSPPVPVLVVTRETGRELLRHVEENPREVYMKVDRLSLQDVVERGGLQVRVSDKNSQQKPKRTSFDFAWAPFHQVPRTVSWQPLALYETTFPHIRLHRLTDSLNDLTEFLSLMSSIPATLALIVISNTNHYRLSERLVSSLQTPPVPVLVVTRETGRELMRLVEEYPRQLEASIETALKRPLTPHVSSPTSLCRSLLLSTGGTSSTASGVVSRGLEVKLTKTEEKRFFNFSWAPFCDTPRSLDWLGLANHQVTYDHIEIHELQSGKSLSFLFSTLGSLTSARALILVSTHDGHELEERFLPGSEGPCLPTVVVSRKTGEELLAILREHGRDVDVRVHGGGVEGEGDGESDDMEEWEVINSPQVEDVPSFPSVTESLAPFITDGLLVNQKKKKTGKEHKFNYMWSPFCVAKREIDWTPLHLSTSLPKTLPHSGCICLHDLRKDRTGARYSSLLQSPAIKALILANSCDSYKVFDEFSVQTQVPVLVVTKGTGEALGSLMRDQPHARVVFGGTDEGGEGAWVVEGCVGNAPHSETNLKIEWEDCVTRSSDEVKTTVVTDKATEPQSTGEVEGERKREGEPTTEEAERGDELQPQLVGGLEKDKTEEGKQTQSETTSAGDSEPRVADTEAPLDPALEQSLAEFTILKVLSEMPQEPAASTPVQPSLPPQPSLPLTMDTPQSTYDQKSLPSLTPTGASSSLGLGEDSSCGTPMLPPQDIVPYNAGPYTGPGSELDENLLSEVSITGAATIPGEVIPALKPTSSKNIDWKKPINNGLQIRPVEFQEQETASHHFTYQWSHTTNAPHKMDWIVITERTDYQDRHIHIHRLQKDSDLQVLMATLDDSPAAALLLVNSRNSYKIDEGYFPPGEMQFWQVPVMVVTSETGEKIRSLLSSCRASGAEARVEIEPPPETRRRSFLKWF